MTLKARANVLNNYDIRVINCSFDFSIFSSISARLGIVGILNINSPYSPYTFQHELSRNRFKKIKNHQNLFKILLLSIYFKLNVSDVYNQVIINPKLFKFLNIKKLQDLKQIRRLYSHDREEKYLNLALKTLNKLQFQIIRNINAIILDSTSVTLDLKFNGKYLSKQKLLDKDYKRRYSTNERHYTGFKMTLIINHRVYKALDILIHRRYPI
jgi:hypothetical protein